MKIAIAGGTGLVGSKLVELCKFRDDEVFVLTRGEEGEHDGVTYVKWMTEGANPAAILEGIDAFVNLAGVSLNGGSWTEDFKKQIYDSRMKATNEAFTILQSLSNRPAVYVNASAVGIYPNSETEIYTEKSNKVATDFLGVTVKDWEQRAKVFGELGMRTAYMRFGVILDREKGALPNIVKPYQFYVGGTIGSGEQWLSWVHVEDVARAILYVIDNESIEGPVNVTSPNVKRMKQFGKVVGDVLGKPHWLKVPRFALKAALGEQSQLVIEGQYVLPEKLLAHGFKFKYASLDDALRNLYEK